VFSVTYDPIAGTATWADLEGTGTPIGDQPVNGVAYDNVSGDLYASTDFGVVKLAGASASNGWTDGGTRSAGRYCCGSDPSIRVHASYLPPRTGVEHIS
jgi:hypothetical protein